MRTTRPWPKIGADFQVAEAVGQLLFQPQAVEQGLEQYQAGERCQLLIFKLDFGKAVCFTVNGRSATLHTSTVSFGFIGLFALPM